MEAILVSRRRHACFFQVQKNKVSFSIRSLVLALVVILPVIGCGGGGSSSSKPPALRTIEALIGPSGGELSFPAEVKLTIPAGALQTQSLIKLSLADEPFARSPVAENYPSGIELLVDGVIATNSAEFSLIFESSVGEFEEGWTVAVGQGRDIDSLDKLPIRISNTQVQIKISAGELSSSRTYLPSSSQPMRLSPARYMSSASQSHGQLYSTGDKPYTATTTELTPVTTVDLLDDKKVAIVIHGIRNDRFKVISTARLAQDACLDSPIGGYDKIWIYDYADTTDHIKENAIRLAGLLRDHGVANCKFVDFYGHSMGGLVARWTIEREGIGEFTHRLFTFGTPHLGVPAGVLGLAAFLLYLPPGARDLDESSEFISDLKGSPSPYKSKVLYCAFAGSDYRNYFPDFGYRVLNKYRKKGFEGPVDGMVVGESAIPSLAEFGVCNPATIAELALTHSEIAGDGESGSTLPYTWLLPKVKAMLRMTGGGVVR